MHFQRFTHLPFPDFDHFALIGPGQKDRIGYNYSQVFNVFDIGFDIGFLLQ